MSDPLRISVDLAGPRRKFVHFWRSTGFSPAELLLEPEMRQSLAFIGGVANRGIEFLRVHYLLDLVTAPTIGRYDFALLDQAIDGMVEHRIRPIFELMGNPSFVFTDFSQVDQAKQWRDFMVQLAERVIARYGAEEVRAWLFESWNEPDRWWRLGGEVGFNNYYDACSEALKAVDPALRLGGPGTARTLAPMFKSFVAHIDTGKNLFTGETGVRLDFLSVHEKGAIKHAEDLTPNTLNIVAKEMRTVEYLRQNHPKLARLPFVNDECDPQVGWILSHTWHGMPYFAGVIAKIIDQHQRLMADKEGVDYAILSNDNGFIGHWGHRTLFAYFGERQINAAQADHVTNLPALAKRRASPAPFDLVKKPALTVMELLALLGDERLAANGLPEPESDLGVIATARGRDHAAFLIYDSADRIWKSGSDRIQIAIDGLTPGLYAQAIFRIEDGKGDPYKVWEALGAPDLPGAAELEAMRLAEEPALAVEPVLIGPKQTRKTIALDLLLPSAVLLVLSKRGETAPAAPTALRAERNAALNGDNAVLFWQPGQGSGVQLFDVLWSAREDGDYAVVNPVGLLASATIRPLGAEAGWFRVRARDLFGRVSAMSSAVTV